MKYILKNGDEVEVDGERYRVVLDELHIIRKGSPPLEERSEEEKAVLRVLPFFNNPPTYDVCPSCGGTREQQGLTGCGQWHYGTYCLV